MLLNDRKYKNDYFFHTGNIIRTDLPASNTIHYSLIRPFYESSKLQSQSFVVPPEKEKLVKWNYETVYLVGTP